MLGGTASASISRVTSTAATVSRRTPVVDQHRHELLHEEGVAVGGRRMLSPRRRGASTPAETCCRGRSRRASGKPSRTHPRRVRARHSSRVVVEHVRPRGAHDQDRPASSSSTRCSISSSRVGAAQWTSSMTMITGRWPAMRSNSRGPPRTARPSAAARRSSPGPTRRVARPPRRPPSPRGCPSPLRRAVRADAGRVAHDLEQRPERDPLPVGQASAAEDRGAIGRSRRAARGRAGSSRRRPRRGPWRARSGVPSIDRSNSPTRTPQLLRRGRRAGRRAGDRTARRRRRAAAGARPPAPAFPLSVERRQRLDLDRAAHESVGSARR